MVGVHHSEVATPGSKVAMVSFKVAKPDSMAAFPLLPVESFHISFADYFRPMCY